MIAPQEKGTDNARAVQAERHPALLQRVLRLRAAMGLTPDQPETRHSFSAAGTWHLIAADAAGDIAGTIRLYVIDRQDEPLAPDDIPQISHVAFPTEAVREQHLFDKKAHECSFIAAGGLFTTPEWRGTGLVGVLGAAAIAMARLHACRFSASYTAIRGRAQDLFSTFGGRPPLLPNEEPLAPFLCPRHNFELQLLWGFLQQQPEGQVLVLTSEAMRRLVDMEDPQTLPLFADAAIATVLSATGGRNGGDRPSLATLMRPVLGARDDDGSALRVPLPGPNAHAHMDGKRVFVRAVRAMCEALSHLAQAQRAKGELDLVVPRQINGRIIEALRSQIHLSELQVWNEIRRRGNTSSSSILLALDTVLRQDYVGRRIGLCAFGAGFTHGAALLR